MTTETAASIIADYLKAEFGALLTALETVVHHGVVGRTWRAPVVCVTSNGTIEVGSVSVNEDGSVVEGIPREDLIRVIRESAPTTVVVGGGAESDVVEAATEAGGGDESVDAWAADLAAELAEETAADGQGSLELSAQDEDPELIWQQVESLLESANEESLLEARNLLPKMLMHVEHRAVALSELAWVEMQLGHEELALDYLEAAGHEFADRGDLASLELLCRKVQELIGQERFEKSVFHRLLRETQIRVRSVEALEDVPVLSGVAQSIVEAVTQQSQVVTVEEDEDLLREGEPSMNLFFVREGRLAVLLQSPDGSMKTIAMLLPGDLVGESSVLEPEHPTCNATVRADTTTSLWKLDAGSVAGLFTGYPELRERLASAREMRKIHSFLSMHAMVGELEASYRTALMGCIRGVERPAAGDVVLPAGQPPAFGYVVAKGAVSQRIGGRTVGLYGPDDFVGFRDALHGIASECEYVALEPSLLVAFDMEKLRQMALEAPPHVVAVLERLG
ncbi:MAG: cyclic nucleotide-binding domain-containing protein [Deltaproteobacteria bacterium]|nr:cyclic nucleotide-binding domain-containing protein [Deltaproteobacteria bacterium]